MRLSHPMSVAARFVVRENSLFAEYARVDRHFVEVALVVLDLGLQPAEVDDGRGRELLRTARRRALQRTVDVQPGLAGALLAREDDVVPLAVVPAWRRHDRHVGVSHTGQNGAVLPQGNPEVVR